MRFCEPMSSDCWGAVVIGYCDVGGRPHDAIVSEPKETFYER
jgi:hypothetical protein